MCKFLVMACMVAGLVACNSKKDFEVIFKDPNLYCATVYQLNTVVMGNNFPPIIASRNYLYANTAAYEVIAGGYPGKYSSLAGQAKGLNSVPKPISGQPVDFEFAALLAFCKLGEAVTFPAGSMQDYVDSLKKLARDHGMPSATFDNSIAYADTVSAAIMKWSKKDNYLQTRGAPEYTVMDSPGRWVPTPPAYASAMEPHWNTIRSVVMDSAAQFTEALTSVFGDHFSYTDTTELEFGIKSRSFASFREAAIENTWARFYGGIHFHQSCIVSNQAGKKIGGLVVERLKMKKS